MNQELRFGVLTIQTVSWEKMVERWQSIEALGFDSVWVMDHFAMGTEPTMPLFEAWTLLAGLATQTNRIRIGVLVTGIPWRNPAFLARQALTVDHLSHGRLELGLGAGLAGDPAHAMTGIEDWAPRERVARFREYVEIGDQLLRNEVTTYQGRYYQLKEAAMNPAPVQQPRPPIVIGAMGSAMLKIAARYADTWSSFGGFKGTFAEKLEETRRRNALLDDYCGEIGREPQTIRRSYLVFEPEAIMRQGAMTIFNSVEAFQDVVKRLTDVGITEFILYYPFIDEQLPIFEQIAKEVIPKLRRVGIRTLETNQGESKIC